MTTSTLDRGAGPCDRAGQPLVSSCGLSNRLVQGWPGCHASLKRREKFLRILLPKKQWNSSLDQSLARPLKSPKVKHEVPKAVDSGEMTLGSF